MNRKHTRWLLGAVPVVAALILASPMTAQVASQSPAARSRPKPVNIETYPAAQLHTGELRFVSQCGFCHGRDAAGGESGPDLTRSELVARFAPELAPRQQPRHGDPERSRDQR